MVRRLNPSTPTLPPLANVWDAVITRVRIVAYTVFITVVFMAVSFSFNFFPLFSGGLFSLFVFI
jgi:hypothetical protein